MDNAAVVVRGMGHTPPPCLYLQKITGSIPDRAEIQRKLWDFVVASSGSTAGDSPGPASVDVQIRGRA